MKMKRFFINFLILSAMLIGLPLMGVWLAGYPIFKYLEFPPKTRFIEHASFSWMAFVLFSVLILLFISPFIIRSFREKLKKQTVFQKSFPWWGWTTILVLIMSWTVAWTRISVFKEIQEYTFTPLWFCYIIIVNALTYRRTGKCMMLDRPVYFLILFPISAIFWWFFEYLNRFVQNWYYVGVYYSTLKYFLLATISFSTVLPAVLGTRDLLMSTPRFKEGFSGFIFVKLGSLRSLAVFFLVLSLIGLGFIGIYPDYLFPLLWVSPLLIMLSLQTLFKEKHLFSDVFRGNWNKVVAAAVSALICGLFWEMWNYYSLAKWEYSVPLVHGFKIFEMPILGYAGYLPFGLECAVVGEMISRLFTNTNDI